MPTLALNGRSLPLKQVRAALDGSHRLSLTRDAESRIARAARTVEKLLATGKPVYGVNTGFGKLSNTRIPDEQLADLQRNLILSHAVGLGDPLSERETRLLMLFRISTLCLGHSGASRELIDHLIAIYNKGILPIIPELGSVGASGDLAPLAHMALTVIGEGRATVQGREMSSRSALKKAGLAPYVLKPKEGLSLINGTQMMCAVLTECLFRLEDLLPLADAAAAATLEGMRWSATPFDTRIHKARPHTGQMDSAANVRRLLLGSKILPSHEDCGKIQDPYCIRCVPQVHGTARDSYGFARSVLETEIVSAVDNPLVFPGRNEILSGGNFHGQPIAQAADQLKIALTSLANMSERRIEKMTNADASGLPAFLTPDSGVNSGFMIAQVAAAALAAECRVLATPASVHTIPTSAEKEDHVSMGPIAVRHLRTTVDHLERILAIEWLCAAQALDFIRPLKPGNGVQAAVRVIRRQVKTLQADRYLKPDIDAVHELVRSGRLLAAVRKKNPKLS
jgi:histidine ammonia-lyase